MGCRERAERRKHGTVKAGSGWNSTTAMGTSSQWVWHAFRIEQCGVENERRQLFDASAHRCSIQVLDIHGAVFCAGLEDASCDDDVCVGTLPEVVRNPAEKNVGACPFAASKTLRNSRVYDLLSA